MTAAAERTERDLRVLDELTELGMRVARPAAREAERAAEAAASSLRPSQGDGPDPALTFTRVARLVAQIIALKHRMATCRPQPQAAGEDPRRAEARRLVHTAASRDPSAQPRQDQLRIDIDHSLDAIDIGAALGACGSVASVVDRLCKRLGIEPAALSGGDPGDGLGEGPDEDPDDEEGAGSLEPLFTFETWPPPPLPPPSEPGPSGAGPP